MASLAAKAKSIDSGILKDHLIQRQPAERLVKDDNPLAST